MKKFLIAEAEKSRILGMHYKAMGKSLIKEALDPATIERSGISSITSLSDDDIQNKRFEVVFSVTNPIYSKIRFYYSCIDGINGEKTGQIADASGKLYNANDLEIKLQDPYINNFRSYCQKALNYLAQQQRSQQPQPQVAAATTTKVNAPNPVTDKDVLAAQKRDEDSKARQQATLANTQTKMTSWMSDTTFLSPEKDKAALDSEVNQVSLIIGNQNTGLSDEQKMFLKRKIKNLVTLKPEYGRDPYYLSTNF